MLEKLRKGKVRIMKKNIIIIVLGVLVLGLSGYLVYDKLLYKEETKSENNGNNNIQKEEKITDDEIKKYLSYVPIGDTWEKDAYTEEKVDINTVSKKAILNTILYNENYDKLSEEDFHNKLEEMYNIQIDQFKFEYSDEFEKYLYEDSLIVFEDGYYFVMGHGSRKDKSSNNKISYELLGNDLIIKEQVALIVSSECHAAVMNGSEFIIEYALCGETGYVGDYEEYIKDNFSNFNTYKHTFKLNSNGKYYWYSTEVINN